MKGYIYKITSPTNKIYIGQTTSIEKRIMYYAYHHCKPQRILYASIKKYGWDNHKLDIIKETEDIESLNKLEIEFIELYKTNINKYPQSNGMNLTDGGEGNKGPKSESWKSKIKTKWESPDYREKMKKIHESPEWKEKCRIRQTGKVLSDETKNKMSRKWLDEEYKNNMSKKLKKKKVKRTDEHSLNLSKSLKGKKLKKEHKFKLSKIKSKPIMQFNLDNTLIREWISIKFAEKELGIFNIGRVCCGKQETAGGYKWKYKIKENE